MSAHLQIPLGIRPVLDPEFLPVAVWNRVYQEAVEESGSKARIGIALERSDGSVTALKRPILENRGKGVELNRLYLERMVKFLLWQKGGYRLSLAGDPELISYIRQIYSAGGERAFDHEFMGRRIYNREFVVEEIELDDLPEDREVTQALGGHFEGCRIGFDLGGSDRKCAAVIDGEVVHSEEVVWDSYFQEDPEWHYREINDSLKRAAAHLPRVDAIGGSAAGVYVDNEVRVASIFRGVSPEDFERRVRRIFWDLKEEWGNVPFVVVNDGEVTALAGSMSLEDGAVLGVAMGTSLAAGYVTPEGHLTTGIDELAFVPVDYRRDAPRDEWSGDIGVGAQYFSQQAVGRLIPAAGIEVAEGMSLPEQLVEVQRLMEEGDDRARKIYETIGVYLGYNAVNYSDHYDVRHILLLGRVMSGPGGEVIRETASSVVRSEFPGIAEGLELVTPGEKEKRHGQAVAAAGLPALAEEE